MNENELLKIKKIVKNNKKSYDLFKYIKKLNNPASVKCFYDDQGAVIDDIKKVTENFKSNFESHFNPQKDLNVFRNVIGLQDHQLLSHITMNDILQALKSFDYKKSQGKTFIPNSVIKKCQNGVCNLFYFLFNKICDKNQFPDKMKIAQVTPILKKGKDKHQIKSYRGVSVIMNIMKIMEIILRKKFYLCLFYENFKFEKQYGYCKKVSIFHQILDLQKVVFEGLNDKKCKAVDVIFLDFSNAFDTIDHHNLFEKFMKNGFDHKLFNIFLNMFSNRKQTVRFQDHFSSISNVTSGVLQGSVLAADFYKYYVNDISQGINSDIFLWADDTVIIKKIYNEDDMKILKNDLIAIENYSEKNFLKLNASKSVHMRFSTKNCDALCFYSIGTDVISMKDEHKHLGLILDNKFNFNSHVNDIVRRSFKQFNMLKGLSKMMDGWTIRDLYKCYVLPIIEYSNLSWFSNSSQNQRIEGIQKKITKYICKKLGKSDLKYPERLNMLNLESIQKRRLIQNLSLLQKIRTNHPSVPSRWHNLFIFKETRDGHKIETPKLRIELAKKLFFNHIVFTFNDLDRDIRDENDFKKFVKLLNDKFKNYPFDAKTG